MDERRYAANEPRPRLERLLRVLLQVVLDREDALRGELLDLRLTVVVPAVRVSDARGDTTRSLRRTSHRRMVSCARGGDGRCR